MNHKETEINKIETKNTIEKISESQSWFSEKINKIGNPYSQIHQEKREDPYK